MGSIVIGISDMNVVKNGGSIITYALGSCVGVALYDGVNNIAGLAHILLPSSSDAYENDINILKYVDTAVPELVRRMEGAGASLYYLEAKIAGGAHMFPLDETGDQFHIGEKNVKMARTVLKKLGIKIKAEDVGSNYGRTVEIFSDTGIYRIRAISKGIKDI